MKLVLFGALTLVLTTACSTSQQPAASLTPTTPALSVNQQPCAVPFNVARPKALLLGDSISMGYTVYVQRGLCGVYDATHVAYLDANGVAHDQNAQGTTFTLANIDRWLAQVQHDDEAKLDVVVWNNGLWNARDPLLDPQAPDNATDLETYESDLVKIAAKLKATGARVLFMTTTDIPATGSTFIPGRDLDENAIAYRVLPALGIEVYDLNALARSNLKLHHTDDPIHFNTQGYSLFGEFIVDMIRADYERSN